MQLKLDLVGQGVVVMALTLLVFFSVIQTLESVHILVLLLSGLFLSYIYNTIKMVNTVDPAAVVLGIATTLVVMISAVAVSYLQSMSMYYLVIVAVAEEVLVRGFMLPFFARLSNVYIAAVASSTVWAVYHIVTSQLNPSYFLYIFISGLVYAAVDIYTSSLTPSLVSHVLVNFLAGVMG